MDEYLTSTEKQALIKLASNKQTMIALKKVLLKPVYDGVLEEGKDPNPMQNYILGALGSTRAVSNDYIGQIVRATVEALTLIENGFKSIEDLAKPVAKEEPKINEAR